MILINKICVSIICVFIIDTFKQEREKEEWLTLKFSIWVSYSEVNRSQFLRHYSWHVMGSVSVTVTCDAAPNNCNRMDTSSLASSPHCLWRLSDGQWWHVEWEPTHSDNAIISWLTASQVTRHDITRDTLRDIISLSRASSEPSQSGSVWHLNRPQGNKLTTIFWSWSRPRRWFLS